MNNLKVLLAVFTKPKKIIIESFRNFHNISVLNQRTLRGEYNLNKDVYNPLFFTNLPKKKKEKKPRILKGPIPSGNLVIKCKRPELNHYSRMSYGKFDKIPLASKGWFHRKSNGDHFTILPVTWHTSFITKEDLPITFEENGISEKVIQQLNKINITHPTVIQAKAIKQLLQGHNLFMSGECGSGKTLAYLIAMIENVLKYKNKMSDIYNAPIGVILLPTRELALQVGTLANKLASDLGIKCQILVGGNTNDLLLHPEMTSVHILICTLKVFLNHLKADLYSLVQCKHVVVDEIDSFLEKRYIKQLELFFRTSKLEFTGFTNVELTNQSAQICFVSATVPRDMEMKLFELIKGNRMKIETTNYLHRTLSCAEQEFLRVTSSTRPEKLLKIVKSNEKTKTSTMIFSNKRSTAAWVAEFLNSYKIKCGTINTKEYASDRLVHFRDFQAGLTNFISCTDLASRGLSFPSVKHVINYEFPSFMIDYIHRCGRTGRLDQGNKCKITNFISGRHEIYLLNTIELAVRTNSSLPKINENRVKSYLQVNKIRKK